MTPRHLARRRGTIRRGFTLLELMLVLVITGILVAAIAAAINIHLRVSEVGRSEVEQAQLARVLLRRIGDDLRSAVPHVEPVPSEAGATADEIAAAAATASGGQSGSTGGASSGSSGGSSGGSTGGGSSGGTSGSSSSSGGTGGGQTLQPLKALSTLKPQSASSSSGSSGGSSGSSSGGAAGSSSGSSSGSGSSSSGSSGSTSSTDTESTEETSTIKPPGIYGDQYTLFVDVSRLSRAGVVSNATIDAPGDVKTIGYQLQSITGAPTESGIPTTGLYRQSTDRAVSNFNQSSGSSATTEMQLLADEVAGLEFRYFDGTTWQTSWDSSSGTLPTAVEIMLTFLNKTRDVTEPKQYRLTVAIPAAQAGSSSSSADTSAESSSSSSSTGTTP